MKVFDCQKYLQLPPIKNPNHYGSYQVVTNSKMLIKPYFDPRIKYLIEDQDEDIIIYFHMTPEEDYKKDIEDDYLFMVELFQKLKKEKTLFKDVNMRGSIIRFNVITTKSIHPEKYLDLVSSSPFASDVSVVFGPDLHLIDYNRFAVDLDNFDHQYDGISFTINEEQDRDMAIYLIEDIKSSQDMKESLEIVEDLKAFRKKFKKKFGNFKIKEYIDSDNRFEYQLGFDILDDDSE